MPFPLPPEFERAVLDRVRSGQYASPEEVLSAMMEALDEHAPRSEIPVGLDQADRGKTVEGEEASEWLRTRIGGIPAELRAFVDEEVRLGRYESADKVIETALAVLHDSQLFEDAAREELLREIGLGLESEERDPPVPAEEVEAWLHTRLCPADVQEFLRKKINVGEYGSVSEAVEAGLRLLKEEDDALRHELRRGREQLDRGQTMPADVAFARLRESRRTA
jgi:putative addiction module CopG family antidote